MKNPAGGQKNYTTPKAQKQFTASFYFCSLSKKISCKFAEIPIYHNFLLTIYKTEKPNSLQRTWL